MVTIFTRNCLSYADFDSDYRKFHSYILQFDGAGSWEFSKLNASSRLDLKNEKEHLLKQAPTDFRDRRIQELTRLLGEDTKQ